MGNKVVAVVWNSVKRVFSVWFLLALAIALTLFLRWAVPFTYVWVDRFTSFAETWMMRITVIAACLLPAFVICVVTADEFPLPLSAPPKQRRRHDLFQIGTALLSGLAASIAVFWYRLGVPPTSDHHLLGIGFFFYVESLTGIGAVLVCAKCRKLVHRKGWYRTTLGLVSIAAINILFSGLPVLWTMADAHFATSTILPVSLTPEQCPVANRKALIAHISDLHITTDKTTRDGKEPGNVRLSALLREINSYNPAYLVISGDLTDNGDTKQWEVLRSLLSKLSPDTRAIFTPGNHDLNQFFGYDPNHEDLGAKDADVTLDFDKIPRLGRLVLFQGQYLPDMVNSRGIKLGDLVHNIPTKSTMQRLDNDIQECTRDCMAPWVGSEYVLKAEQGCHLRCSTDWRVLRFRYFHQFKENFPWMYIDEQRRVAFFSLASTLSNTDTAGQNAIGYIGDDQIAHLQVLLHGLPPTVRLVVLTLHHPLFYTQTPSMPGFTLGEMAHPRSLWNKIYLSDWFLTVFLHNNAIQARHLYTMLSKELAQRGNTTAIVMFGHRHKRSLSTLPSIILEEAPNVATETLADYGFYTVTEGTNLSPAIHWCPANP